MRGGQLRPATFPSLCALIHHPSEGPILYDTGYGERFAEATSAFPERLYRWITPVTLPDEEALTRQLAKRGVMPQDVRHVVISHFHADHVAGAKSFPNAKYTAMRGDYLALRGLTRVGALMHGFLPSLLPEDFESRLRFAEDAKVVALPSALAPFDTGFDLLGDGSLVAVPLPGHSRRQQGLWVAGDDGRDYFFVADACWSMRAVRENRPPMWIAGIAMDERATYAETFDGLRAVHSRDPDLALVPSHCEETWRSLAHESC
jgi:glyoxylase-like metal-dependent hydrolase (beta-lactamase superfamily II)